MLMLKFTAYVLQNKSNSKIPCTNIVYEEYRKKPMKPRAPVPQDTKLIHRERLIFLQMA